MPTVFIKTFGCQMNERDSEAVAAQLQSRGYVLTADESAADVVLLNTCSVRDAADQKALGSMQTLANTRTPSRRVYGFLGCMAQARGEELLKMPGVGLVLGTQKFHRTGEYLEELLAGKRQQICDTAAESGSQSAISEHLAVRVEDGAAPVAASVSIMQGCNQRCTFCIVPFTRGLERSRSIEEIVAEARQLARQGVREILLLGQIVTSYGKREVPERDGKSPFVQLLDALATDPALEDILRIRFTAPHPKGYGDDLIDAYRRLPKLCPSAHLPIQSGSDRVLKLMHRGYTAERCVEIVRKLRQARPEIGITTDLIVGFPGETEADFEDTLKLANTIEFDNAYVYKYSPRRDTPAADMPDQWPDEVKEARHARLLERINTLAQKRHDAFIGQTVNVLVEGPSRRNSARWTGRSGCNKIVLFDAAQRQRGEFLPVRIERTGKFTLYGQPMGETR